jgi:HK97 family phage major capsid protein
MNVKELLEKRNTLLKNSNAILAKAEGEKRDLSETESRRFDQLHEEMKTLNVQLESAQNEARARGDWQGLIDAGGALGAQGSAGATDPETGLPYEIRGTDQNQDEWRTNDGKTTRALHQNESAFKYIERKNAHDPELAEIRIGAVLRSMALGCQNEAERRALAAGIDTAGGYTTPSVLGAKVIDLMRPRLVIGRAGARVIPLEGGELKFATIEQDPVPGWRGENELVTEEEVLFGSLALRPKTIAMIIKASRELLESSSNIESLLESILSKTMANAIDKAALTGETGQAIMPTGVINWPGILEVQHNNTPSYDMLLQGRGKLLQANSEEPTAAILSVRDETYLSALRDGEGVYLNRPPALETPRKLPILCTNNMPVDLGAGSDESIGLIGDFSKMVIAQKTGIRIQILQERYQDRMQIGFLIYAMLDTALEQPEAFCKITGIQEPGE